MSSRSASMRARSSDVGLLGGHESGRQARGPAPASRGAQRAAAPSPQRERRGGLQRASGGRRRPRERPPLVRVPHRDRGVASHDERAAPAAADPPLASSTTAASSTHSGCASGGVGGHTTGELAVNRIEGGPMKGTERVEIDRRRLAARDRLAELRKRAVEQPRDLEEAPRPGAPTLEHGEERLPGATVEPQRSRRQLAQPVDEALTRSVLLIEHERCLHADVECFTDRRNRHEVDDTDATAAVAQRRATLPRVGALVGRRRPSRLFACVPDASAARAAWRAW